MRNLELLRSFPVLELDGLESSFCLTVDSECGVIYTATNSGITGFHPSNQQVEAYNDFCDCFSTQTFSLEMEGRY